jgi:hypothetical protein
MYKIVIFAPARQGTAGQEGGGFLALGRAARSHPAKHLPLPVTQRLPGTGHVAFLAPQATPPSPQLCRLYGGLFTGFSEMPSSEALLASASSLGLDDKRSGLVGYPHAPCRESTC